MTPLWARVVAVLAVLGAAYWWVDRIGYQRGVAACEARHTAQVAAIQADLDKAAVQSRADAADLESYRDAARILAEGIENETRADVDVCRAPKPDSLRRLQRRWSVPN